MSELNRKLARALGDTRILAPWFRELLLEEHVACRVLPEDEKRVSTFADEPLAREITTKLDWRC